MRLITWQRIGIIASVIWVVAGPTYFHLSREDNDKRAARDQYQRCIQNQATKQGGVERCNKDLRQALAVAHWTSWGQLAFIPVAVGWGLVFLVRRIRGRPKAISVHGPYGANALREVAVPPAKDNETAFEREKRHMTNYVLRGQKPYNSMPDWSVRYARCSQISLKPRLTPRPHCFTGTPMLIRATKSY